MKGSHDSAEPLETPITMDRPSPARMYDYCLGGSHNFPADRQAAEQLLAVYPDASLMMRANRAFLRRAVRFLVEHGIDQFLDIGSGIPTVGNVHEIVHQRNPAAHIVYVDSDPIAVRHSLAVLRDIPSATIIQADARQPEHILAHPEVHRLLDFNRPVAVLLVALLHFITDDAEASSLVDALRLSLIPGSYLAPSRTARTRWRQVTAWYRRSGSTPRRPIRVGPARVHRSSLSLRGWSWWNPVWFTPPAGTPIVPTISSSTSPGGQPTLSESDANSEREVPRGTTGLDGEGRGLREYDDEPAPPPVVARPTENRGQRVARSASA